VIMHTGQGSEYTAPAVRTAGSAAIHGPARLRPVDNAVIEAWHPTLEFISRADRWISRAVSSVAAP
jgi:transposase InsO family protein